MKISEKINAGEENMREAFEDKKLSLERVTLLNYCNEIIKEAVEAEEQGRETLRQEARKVDVLRAISIHQKLSEDFIREFQNEIDWWAISIHQKLSEDFIREFQNRVNWAAIASYQKLSEDFIREFQSKVDWEAISKYQKLSEEFIREFQSKVDWTGISNTQKLSEDFIREFQSKVDWEAISKYQKLSEEFIREFQSKVDWKAISKPQKLSEGFIREFQSKIDWEAISIYQKLSEEFIREFQSKVDWEAISKFQKCSAKFRREFNLSTPKNSWLYVTTRTKLAYIKKHTNYEIINDTHIIAYKIVRDNYYSVYNFQYKYEPNKAYHAHCDCSLGDENSFGLSAWTKQKALEYYPQGKLLQVKIPVAKIGAIVQNDCKIRCFEFTVLREVEND